MTIYHFEMKKILSLLCCIFTSLILTAQPGNNFWENYTSGYEIHDIAFEGDTIWVATRGGLTQINQSAGTTYYYNASNSLLSSNYINKVVVDLNHVKYIATDKALFSFNGVHWKEFATGEVKYLEVDLNNIIWFLGKNPTTGIDGLIKFDGNTFTNITYANSNVPNMDYKIITTDNDKNLWLLTGFLVTKHVGNQWQIFNNTNPNLSTYTGYWTFAVDANDGIWLANNDTISYFNNTSWIAFNNSNSPLISPYFSDITPDDSGNVYICNNYRFYKTDGTNWQTFDTTNCAAAHHSIYRCTVDQNQKLWFGTVRDCIYSYDFVTWKQYNTSKTIMQTNFVKGVAAGKNNMIGIHTSGNFVLKNDTNWYNFDYYSPGLHQREAIAVDTSNVFWACLYYLSASGPIAYVVDSLNGSVPSYLNNHCNDVTVDGLNNKWFATSDGIVKFDGTNWTRFNSSNSPIIDDYVMRIFADKDNTIWVSEPYGALQKFNGSTWQTVNLTTFGFPANFPNNFAEDLQGNVYVAAGWYGTAPPQQIGKYDGVTWSLLPNLPGTMIGSMSFDLNDNLWVGFIDAGLAKYDGTNWTLYTVQNSGLPDINIRDLSVDEYNNIWIATAYGAIAVFNDRELNFSVPLPNRLKISGNFFFDVDSNGIKNGNEPFLNHQKVIANSSSMAAYTNSSGNYTLNLQAGVYTLQPQLRPNWFVTTDSSQFTVVVDSTSLTGYNFGLSALPFSDYSLDFYSGINRCGFEIPCWINYSNTGSTLDSGYVELIVDNICSAVSFNPQPDYNNGSVFRWNFSHLSPFTNNSIVVHILNPILPGDTVNHVASIHYYNNSNAILANSAAIDDEIVCAFDPNDKRVIPAGVTSQHLTLLSDTLNYIIRFQNVGNDTAFFVKIVDSLDVNIDPQSLDFVSASHNFNWDFINGKLYIDFPNCLLPDSATNPVGSNGYVHFKANVFSSTPTNTIVKNKANIIFNFNEAIITNEVFNTLVDTIVGVTENMEKNSFTIIPNPFTNETLISFSNENNSVATISLYNLLGDVVLKNQTTQDHINIQRNNLSSGIYITELILDGKRLFRKLVIQ